MQCLACICDVLAICFRDLRGIARIIDCIADIVFFSVAGCMAGQLYAEKNYQKALVAQTGAEPLMRPGDDPHKPPGYASNADSKSIPPPPPPRQPQSGQAPLPPASQP